MEVKDIITKIYEQAKQLGACDLFKGDEDLEGIITLLKSPQGIEFCSKHHFPNVATFRLFKPFKPERYGVYIDAGVVTLKNAEHVVLIGRTVGVLQYDQSGRHVVTVLQGATANVLASNWSVVRVDGVPEAKVIKSTSGNAIIL